MIRNTDIHRRWYDATYWAKVYHARRREERSLARRQLKREADAKPLLSKEVKVWP